VSRSALPLVAALIVIGASPPARADEAAAEAAFREARRLMKEGRPAEACPQFEASYREAAALGALLNLAVCHQEIGRIASAYAELRDAEEMARQRADSREAIARELADALEPRLTWLRIHVVTPVAPGMVIVRNAVDVTEDLGFAVPVDPGEYSLEATAPGRVAWTATIRTGGEGQTVSVFVPTLQATPVRVTSPLDAAVALPTPAAPASAIASPVPRNDDRSRSSRQRTVAIGLGVASAVVLSGAVAAEVWGRILYTDVEADREDNRLTQEEADALVAEANVPHYAAQGLAVAGAGLAAASAYLWLTRDEAAPRGRSIAVTPAVTTGGVHAVLRGTF
jgi:hypothetical protein